MTTIRLSEIADPLTRTLREVHYIASRQLAEGQPSDDRAQLARIKGLTHPRRVANLEAIGLEMAISNLIGDSIAWFDLIEHPTTAATEHASAAQAETARDHTNTHSSPSAAHTAPHTASPDQKDRP